MDSWPPLRSFFLIPTDISRMRRLETSNFLSVWESLWPSCLPTRYDRLRSVPPSLHSTMDVSRPFWASFLLRCMGSRLVFQRTRPVTCLPTEMRTYSFSTFFPFLRFRGTELLGSCCSKRWRQGPHGPQL